MFLLPLLLACPVPDAGPAPPPGAAPAEPTGAPTAAADPAASPHAAATPATASAPAWPAPGAPLAAPAIAFPDGWAIRRIAVDAGHGVEGNTGAPTVTCRSEQDVVLEIAEHLAASLRATGRFDVRQTRTGLERPDYDTRIREAEAWPADALVSIHADYRGAPFTWSPNPGLECPRMDEAPGFSVLWSDEGDEALVAARLSIARAIAAEMRRAGFLPYDGLEYEALYQADAEVPGVFLDRHAPGHRIRMLRAPKVPSVIVETHHGLDFEEAARWEEPVTRETFDAAVTAALIRSLP